MSTIIRNHKSKIVKIIEQKYSLEDNPIFRKNTKKIIWIKKDIKNGKKNYLIYGSVQSGKTKYLIILTHILDSFNVVVYLSGNKNILHEQNIKDMKKSLKENNDFLIYDKFNANQNLNTIIKRKKIIFFLKKISNDMDSLENLQKSHDFSKYNFILIDDECDNATPLIKKNKNISKSSINKYVSKFAKNNNVIYIGCTATPYYLINMEDDPKPNAFIVLEDLKEYKGLQFYNKRSFYNQIDLKKTNRREVLKQVLEDFIISSINMNLPKNPQLIINIAHEISDIDDIAGEVEFIKNFDLALKYSKNVKVRQFLEKIYINKFVFGESHHKLDVPNINIGCFMLSRGVRFENLTHVLIYSSSNNLTLDTFVQRARWFGYKKWNVKIWTTSELIDFYTEIAPKIDFEIRDLFLQDQFFSDKKQNKVEEIFKKYRMKNKFKISNK